MLKTLNKYEPSASIGVAIVLAGIDLRVAAVFLAFRFVTVCLALRRLVNGMIPVAKPDPRIMPRRPEAEPVKGFGLSDPRGLFPIDAVRLMQNRARVNLALKLGLDLGLRRDGGAPEWYVAGDSPIDKTGRLMVRNQSI